ncbi:MAG TPA: hypothetical protein EYP10_03810, partial [Armatimonadetes bacterium]|nr:hypothetical protein [Armatimonadota bacterium]
EQWAQQRDATEAERLQIERERDALRKEIDALQQSLADAEGEAQRIEAKISQINSALSQKVQEREVARAHFADVRLRHAQVSEKMDAVRRETDEVAGLLREVEDTLKRHYQSIEQYKLELNALEERLPQLEAERTMLLQSREEVEQAFEQWREQRRRLSEQLEEIEARIRERMERKSQLEAELNKVEVRRAETRTEQEEIARRLVEEFQTTPEEAQQQAESIEQKQSAVEELNELKGKMERMGAVNLGAIDEYERLKQRVEYLTKQQDDLETARADLQQIIERIDEETRNQFMSTIHAVEREFQALFVRMFGGGEVHLVVTNPEDVLHSGVEIRVRLPDKAEQDILALSGGERAMTAICLIFAMLKVRPVPFCILDEVDAALDEANINKFANLLRDYSARSQFIVITHNYGTLEAVDRIYGVTMAEEGVSQVLSLSLDQVRLTEAPPSAAG